jgi:hypothetical protein
MYRSVETSERFFFKFVAFLEYMNYKTWWCETWIWCKAKNFLVNRFIGDILHAFLCFVILLIKNPIFLCKVDQGQREISLSLWPRLSKNCKEKPNSSYSHTKENLTLNIKLHRQLIHFILRIDLLYIVQKAEDCFPNCLCQRTWFLYDTGLRFLVGIFCILRPSWIL